MNKKTQRHTFRAPTTQPMAEVTPSGAIAIDGELPHAASNGAAAHAPASAPMAAHDVLHAAMAHADADGATAAPDGIHDTTGASDAAMPSDQNAMDAVDALVQEAESGAVAPVPGASGKKSKKNSKTAASETVDPVAAVVAPNAKPARDKFVNCNFSLTQNEATLLNAMKQTHQANGVKVKKSQLLRAALLNLAEVDSERLAELLAQLPNPAVSRKKKK